MIGLLMLGAVVAGSGPMADIGVGQRSCRSWTIAKARQGKQRQMDETWFWGLLDGLDVASWKSDENKIIWPSDTPRDFLDHLDGYCSAHPSAEISAGAKELFRYLRVHSRL